MKTFINKKGLIKIKRNKYADYNIVYSHKGRLIDLKKPIMVYKNLHKDMYSIKQGKRVVAHSERLCIRDFKCIVNQKERLRVIKTGHKNVHAYIKGFYDTNGMGTTAERNDLPAEIKYNPFKNKTFICDNLTAKPVGVDGGWFCILDKKGVRGSYVYFSIKK